LYTLGLRLPAGWSSGSQEIISGMNTTMRELLALLVAQTSGATVP
jgi:hypothetical protein